MLFDVIEKTNLRVLFVGRPHDPGFVGQESKGELGKDGGFSRSGWARWGIEG
jgi:hypothetical protein